MEIERPENVTIPRWLQLKMDARNASSMTKAELESALGRAGIEAPKGTTVDEMRTMLVQGSASGGAMGRVLESSTKKTTGKE